MKKIISLLAVMALLCTSVFAAGSVSLNDTSFENVLLFEEDFEDGLTAGASFSPDQKSKEVISYDGGVATIKIDPGKTPSNTSIPGYRASTFSAAKYSKPSGNFLSIQYDIGIFDFEKVPADKQILYVPLGTANLDGGGSWKFGTNYPAFKVVEEGEEGAKEKKIYFAEVEFDSTKMNTVSYYLNYEDYTYTVYLNDTKLEKTYTFSKEFTEFHKIEFSTGDDETYEDVVLKVDNIKVFDNPSKESALQVIMDGDTLEIDSEGNVTFGAVLPKGFGSAKAYINDVEMDVDIAEISGAEHNSYVIKAPVPNGVPFGDATFKLVAGEGTVTKKVELVKEVEVEVGRLTSTKTDGSEQKMALPEKLEDGKYRIHFDFAVTDAASFKLGLRLCPDTSKGNGALLGGTSEGGRTSSGGNAWAYWYKDKLTASGATLYTDGSLNSVDVIIDYHGPDDGKRPYKMILNGAVAIESTFKMPDDATYNGFIQFGYNSKGTSEPKNIVIYELFSYPQVKAIKLNYEGDISLDYADEALTSVGLKNITYTLDQEISNTEGNILLVDGDGAEVEGAQISVSGNVISVDYAGAVLPADVYKLVIGKNVVAKAEALYAAVEIPVELSDEDAILPIIPADNGKVIISAYAKEAEKILLYVDEYLVAEIPAADSNNGLYEKEVEVAEGMHAVDVYTVCGSEIALIGDRFTFDAGYAKKGYAEYNRTGTVYATTKDLTESARRFAGRVAFEFDLTIPEKGDRAYFELGAATKYDYAYAGDGYKTLKDAIGYANTENALFNENGTIADTGIAYPIGEEFTLKYVCDTITDTYEVYINGELVATKQSVAQTKDEGSMPLANMEVIGCKIRLHHKDTNGNGTGGVIVGEAKVRTWQEFIPPTVVAVAGGGADAATENGYIVTEGSEDIVVTFDKAYNSLDDMVSILVNGSEKEAGISYDKDAKTLTVSGLERKAGDIIKVVISKDALMDVDSVETVDDANAFATVPTAVGTDVETVIYTCDANGLWIMPLGNVYGTDDVTVYTKYINNGDEQSKKMFLGTYGKDGLIAVKYQTKTLSPLSKGLISINGTAGDYTQGESWKASLWNGDMTPYITAVGE